MVDGGAHRSNTSAVSPSLEEIMTEELKRPVPADGIIPLSIPLKKDTEILMIDVRSAFKGQLNRDERNLGQPKPFNPPAVGQQ